MENKKEKLVLDGNAFMNWTWNVLSIEGKICREKKSDGQKETDKGRGNDPLLFVCRL